MTEYALGTTFNGSATHYIYWNTTMGRWIACCDRGTSLMSLTKGVTDYAYGLCGNCYRHKGKLDIPGVEYVDKNQLVGVRIVDDTYLKHAETIK